MKHITRKTLALGFMTIVVALDIATIPLKILFEIGLYIYIIICKLYYGDTIKESISETNELFIDAFKESPSYIVETYTFIYNYIMSL